MPMVDGPGFLTALAAEGMGDVPVIAMSAQDCPETLQAARFFPKLFDVDLLLTTVEELVSSAQHTSHSSGR